MTVVDESHTTRIYIYIYIYIHVCTFIHNSQEHNDIDLLCAFEAASSFKETPKQ